MRALLMVAAALTFPNALLGQDTASLRSIRDPYPDWVSDDSNLVDVDWALRTITKNTLFVGFRPGTSREARAAAVRAVHGTVIQGDSNFYLVRVSSHPNACGVKQALELLRTLP